MEIKIKVDNYEFNMVKSYLKALANIEQYNLTGSDKELAKVLTENLIDRYFNVEYFDLDDISGMLTTKLKK